MRIKKLTGIVAALMAATTATEAGTVITVADQKLSPGCETTLKLDVTTTETNLLAFQFALSLPQGLTLATADADGRDMADVSLAGADSHDIVGAKRSEDYMFVCKSDQNDALPGSFSLSLTLRAGEDAVSGTAAVKDILFSQKDGTQHKGYAASDASFAIAMGRIPLDEAGTTAPQAVKNAAVSMTRTISAGEWSTLCLPFDMSEAQVTAAFGSDVVLADFTGYECHREEGRVVGIDVKFAPLTTRAIAANHPYLIRTQRDVTTFMVDGVDLRPQAQPVVAAVTRTSTQWSEMKGTYTAGEAIPAGALFINGNKFWYSNGQTVMKGYRAYFDFSDVLAQTDEANVRVSLVADGETTALETVSQADRGAAGAYSLSGVRMGLTTKGIGIVRGRKIIRK